MPAESTPSYSDNGLAFAVTAYFFTVRVDDLSISAVAAAHDAWTVATDHPGR